MIIFQCLGHFLFPLCQFDNFVETEDEQVDTESKEEADMEELLGTSGYTASFLGKCLSWEEESTGYVV